MEFQKVLVFLQTFLLGAVLARRDKIVGGAEKLARPYLNLMREKQAQVVEEVDLKRNKAMMEAEKVWEEEGRQWGSLLKEELGLVRHFPNWWPWGTRTSKFGTENNENGKFLHSEL